jgi:hypothetical protein
MNKKRVGFVLLTLIFVVTLLGFRPKTAISFAPNNHIQNNNP